MGLTLYTYTNSSQASVHFPLQEHLPVSMATCTTCQENSNCPVMSACVPTIFSISSHKETGLFE